MNRCYWGSLFEELFEIFSLLDLEEQHTLLHTELVVSWHVFFASKQLFCINMHFAFQIFPKRNQSNHKCDIWYLILVAFFPSDQQVDFLLKRRHIYLLPGGCLNISAINGPNFEYVIESIHLALTTPLWPRVFNVLTWNQGRFKTFLKASYIQQWTAQLQLHFSITTAGPTILQKRGWNIKRVKEKRGLEFI